MISVTVLPIVLAFLPIYPEGLDLPGSRGPEVTIVAVGDMMVGSWGTELLDERGADYPFENVRDILAGADVATGNLEGPHCTTGEAMQKTYTFRMPPAGLDGYRNAGFDVLNIANNHAMDFGADCFLESLAEIEARGMTACGGGPDLARANRPAVLERNGVRIAVLGYSATFPEEAWATEDRAGTVFPERSILIRAVEEAARAYDVIVVHFHWGRESTQDLRDYQSDLARLTIDHGADLVIGHHPHVLQGIESYRGRLIFYSLGNFTFASYSETARTAAMARVTFDRDGALVGAEVIPLNVYNREVDLRPMPLPGDPGVLDELRNASEKIEGGTAAHIGTDGRVRVAEDTERAAVSGDCSRTLNASPAPAG